MILIDIFNGLAIGRTSLTLPTVAMWRLNRMANAIRGPWREIIYSLKNVYVKMLYEGGHCVKLTREDHIRVCWHTRAYNEGQVDYCEKCNNTGIYSRHPLYRFDFVVDGTPYVWHQPVSLVGWPVKLDDGEVTEWRGKASAFYYDKATTRKDAWVVWWCLLSHGYRAFPPLGLYKPRFSRDNSRRSCAN